MKRTKNILTAVMYGSIILSLAITILYETETLLPGDLTTDKNAEFLTVSLMEVITICLIPLALRLFKFKKVGQALVSNPAKELLQWGTLRLAMLCLPMVINTLLYYLYMNVASAIWQSSALSALYS